jgi:RHS repeat-associated protein
VPFRYAGEYADPDSGLIYLRARFYDPGTGQFLTRDPLEGITHDPYVYASGDPVNHIDPLGLDAVDAVFGPDGLVDDVMPDPVSNASAGFLDGWTEGQMSKAFGVDQWCDAPRLRRRQLRLLPQPQGHRQGRDPRLRETQGGRKPDLKEVDRFRREAGIPQEYRHEFGPGDREREAGRS